MNALARALPELWRARRYIPFAPSPKQVVASLALREYREILFGGSIRGGKTAFLLMDALSWTHVPGYGGLILRASYAELEMPGGPLWLAKDWLSVHDDVTWDGKRYRFMFPSGAAIQFGFLQSEDDHLRYKGTEFQRLYADEITDYRRKQFLYLLTRLQRPKLGPARVVPVRAAATANPVGPGRAWVKDRYIDNPGRARLYIPATYRDNPGVDHETTERGLAEQDEVTRRQLGEGDWDAVYEGPLFHRSWFDFAAVEAPPYLVRSWDLAWSDQPDAKRTVGVLCHATGSGMHVAHGIAGRWRPGERDRIIRQTAENDPPGTLILIEKEPGGSGIVEADELVRVLQPHRVILQAPAGDKFVRARPLASAAQRGRVTLANAAWAQDALDELCAVDPAARPDRQMLDYMDALSQAYGHLAALGSVRRAMVVGQVARDTVPAGAAWVPGVEPEDDWSAP